MLRGGDMVILLYFCASLATRSKHSILFQVIGGCTLPALADEGQGKICYCYKWHVLDNYDNKAVLKKIPRAYLFSKRFQTVPLGVLRSWLRSHRSGGGEPPGQGSDPSLPTFRQEFPPRSFYLFVGKRHELFLVTDSSDPVSFGHLQWRN